ncbi:RNA polymerase sigma factor [Nocardioides pyridinolyticus]
MSPELPPAHAAVERIYREEYGRVVASLVRRFGDIDIAEEAAGEALLAALERWPADGVPPNPGGWLTTTAGNRAIDRIRRESHRDAKHQAALMISPELHGDDTPHEPTGIVEDDRLRLIFTCCHPALAPEARVALTLRLLGGLTVAEIAQAFLVPETTMAQRITRAKKKIKDAHIPYRVPEAADLTGRLGAVLAVVYLVRECPATGRPGQYQLLAAINAVHTDAPDAGATDWSQIAALYGQLYAVAPSPVVALNRAVAVAELDGPAVALAEVDRLPEIQPSLTTYHAWHATRADLLRRLGRSAEARAAYDAAIGATDNPAERAYLSRRRGSLAP